MNCLEPWTTVRNLTSDVNLEITGLAPLPHRRARRLDGAGTRVRRRFKLPEGTSLRRKRCRGSRDQERSILCPAAERLTPRMPDQPTGSSGRRAVAGTTASQTGLTRSTDHVPTSFERCKRRPAVSSLENIAIKAPSTLGRLRPALMRHILCPPERPDAPADGGDELPGRSKRVMTGVPSLQSSPSVPPTPAPGASAGSERLRLSLSLAPSVPWEVGPCRRNAFEMCSTEPSPHLSLQIMTAGRKKTGCGSGGHDLPGRTRYCLWATSIQDHGACRCAETSRPSTRREGGTSCQGLATTRAHAYVWEWARDAWQASRV